MNIPETIMTELPVEILRFLNTLDKKELDQLQKLDPHLVAKVYKAGAVFSIDVASKLAKEEANT